MLTLKENENMIVDEYLPENAMGNWNGYLLHNFHTTHQLQRSLTTTVIDEQWQDPPCS